MREKYLVACTEEEDHKLASIQKRKELPVVSKDVLVPLYEQSYQVTRTISHYLSQILVPQLFDPIDEMRVLFYIENYIKLNEAEDIFLQIAENKFDKVFDRKLLPLTEGVRLVEYSDGKWRVTPRLYRPSLLELLKRYERMTNIPVEDLIVKVNNYNPLSEKEKENEDRGWHNFMVKRRENEKLVPNKNS